MEELARLGGPLACAGLAVLLVATRRDLRLAGLAAWALGAGGLVLYLMPSGHAALLAAGAVVGLAAAVGLAFVFHRWPWLVPLAALACVPVRVPVTVGSVEANLLLPLYGVVAGAALAFAYDVARGDARTRELGIVAIPLAAFLAWSGLTLLWTEDLREGAVTLLAFYLPFAVLAIVLARLLWRRTWLAALACVLGVLALVFAGVGVYQWIIRDVVWNPKLPVPTASPPSAYF